MEKTFNIKCTSDGDGDFRPLFEPDVQFNRDDGYVPEKDSGKIPSRIYDAG